jgi:hypothetical protein
MKSFALLLLGLPLLFQTLSAQTTQPFSYKTDILGLTSFEDFAAQLDATQKDRLSLIPDCLSPKNGTRMCYVEHYLEGPSSFLIFVDDKLAEIDMSIPQLECADYLAVLSTKFGKPLRTTKSYSNSFGATTKGNVWKWKNAKDEAVLAEIDKEPNSSHLAYSDKLLTAEYLKRTATKPAI